jgi:hypothetical protein
LYQTNNMPTPIHSGYYINCLLDNKHELEFYSETRSGLNKEVKDFENYLSKMKDTRTLSNFEVTYIPQMKHKQQ